MDSWYIALAISIVPSNQDLYTHRGRRQVLFTGALPGSQPKYFPEPISDSTRLHTLKSWTINAPQLKKLLAIAPSIEIHPTIALINEVYCWTLWYWSPFCKCVFIYDWRINSWWEALVMSRNSFTIALRTSMILMMTGGPIKKEGEQKKQPSFIQIIGVE